MGTTTLKTLAFAAALATGSSQMNAAWSPTALPGPYFSGEIGVESGGGTSIYTIAKISRILDSSSDHAASHAEYEGFLSPRPVNQSVRKLSFFPSPTAARIAHGRKFMRQVGRQTALGLMALTVGIPPTI